MKKLIFTKYRPMYRPMYRLVCSLAYSLVFLCSFHASATEKEANSYFQQRATNFNQRHLNFYFYNSIKDRSYSWAVDKQNQLLDWNAGISYKWDNFGNFGDAIFKIKFSSFKIDKKSVFKNSLLLGVSFPDIDSGFPFYFGVGLGGSLFFNQVYSESIISVDYQTYVGLRFINIYQNLGSFIEWGLDNHFFLLSSGQYDNIYFAVGLSFVF